MVLAAISSLLSADASISMWFDLRILYISVREKEIKMKISCKRLDIVLTFSTINFRFYAHLCQQHAVGDVWRDGQQKCQM